MDKTDTKVVEIEAPGHMKKVDAFDILTGFRKDTPKKPNGKKKNKRLNRENVTPRKNRKLDEWLRK